MRRRKLIEGNEPPKSHLKRNEGVRLRIDPQADRGIITTIVGTQALVFWEKHNYVKRHEIDALIRDSNGKGQMALGF